jgi:hypothetical protein
MRTENESDSASVVHEELVSLERNHRHHNGQEHTVSPAIEEKTEHVLEGIEELLEELVDLEECAHENRKPPRAKQYRIRIDGQKYTVSVHGMTGRELLVLANKQPVDSFMIVEKVHGEKPRRIGLDEYVDFTKPGVEKFITQPLGQTEG